MSHMDKCDMKATTPGLTDASQAQSAAEDSFPPSKDSFPSFKDQSPTLARHDSKASKPATAPTTLTAASKLFWYILLVLVHCAWAVFPVSSRYMLTRLQPPMEPFRLSFYVALLACLSLLLFKYVPYGLHLLWSRLRGSKPPQPLPSIPTGPDFWPWARALAILAGALCILTFGTILAPRFTSGSWVQLISLSAPIFVAMLTSLVLRLPVPRILWPTLVGVCGGAVLVIYGGWQGKNGSSGGSGMEITPQDLIGFAIALVAVLGMAVFYVFVQMFDGLVAADHVVCGEFVVMMLAFAPLSAGLEEPNWDAIQDYDWVFWVQLVFMGSLVYYFCNVAQQYVIRAVGASVFSITSVGVRLPVTILFSWALLGERMTSWMQWLGCAITVVCIGVYMYFQFYGKYDEGLQEEALEVEQEYHRQETLSRIGSGASSWLHLTHTMTSNPLADSQHGTFNLPNSPSTNLALNAAAHKDLQAVQPGTQPYSPGLQSEGDLLQGPFHAGQQATAADPLSDDLQDAVPPLWLASSQELPSHTGASQHEHRIHMGHDHGHSPSHVWSDPGDSGSGRLDALSEQPGHASLDLGQGAARRRRKLQRSTTMSLQPEGALLRSKSLARSACSFASNGSLKSKSFVCTPGSLPF